VPLIHIFKTGKGASLACVFLSLPLLLFGVICFPFFCAKKRLKQISLDWFYLMKDLNSDYW
jgi:hypothetical protein